jgi:pyruvate dehydrogenase E1 component alpha subunit/2-oxoisovalerate dehydrogenase E1 component alpha subunit
MANESPKQSKGGPRRRRPGFQMRISTKYAPRKPAEGKPRSCIAETSLKPDQLLELYRYLKLTRLVEERIVNLYRQTKVVGGVYRSLGQEATAVGSAYALRPDDFITPIIRDLGAVFVKGIRPREIFAQYMAKAWGPSGGKDLNVHFGYLDKGFLGPISHLGDMIPVMTGILLGARMQQKDIVGLAYIGDGGASTGAFYEGMNFAAVQRLPLAERAAAFGIPGYIVDGNDVVACYEVTKEAIDYARKGRGAVLIEAKTYRRKGHAEHDDQRYVPKDEIEWWEQHNDPIDRFERYLLDRKIADREKLEAITADVMREIDEDCEWAESSPMPEPEGAAYGVFDNSIVPPAMRPKVLES